MTTLFEPTYRREIRFDARGQHQGRSLADALGLGDDDAATWRDAVARRTSHVRLGGMEVELLWRADGGSALLEVEELDARLRRLERLESCAQGSRDGLWEWNLRTGACWMSPRFKQMLGYAPHELPDTLEAWLACLHPEEAAERTEAFRNQVHSETTYDFEHRLRHRDGTYGWYRFRGRTVFSEEGRATRAAGSLTDICHRKSLEAGREQAVREAAMANAAKSDFLARMSHELRTPMNGVMGMLELAYGASVSDEQREWLRVARSSAEDMLVVLNDVLDLSKVEAGVIELESQPMDVGGALQDVCAVLRTTAESKGVTLSLHVHPAMPDWVVGDAVRIRQVLKNLINNAVKFTEQGSVRVRARYDDGMLAVAVNDDGCGIPASRLGSIFEPFVQADSSITRRFGGTGLGLPIARQLARLFGGDVIASSKPGRGSTFIFTAQLPRCGEAMRQTRDVLPEGGVRTDLRVLVVEDHPVNQMLALRFLRNLGIEAIAVGNGLEAVHEVGQRDYDIVLMDCDMPVMDGFEATRNIRSLLAEQPVIVALTASAMTGDRERCLGAGMDDYLSKPMTVDGLREVLRRNSPTRPPRPV